MDYTVGNICAQINAEKTKELYSSLSRNKAETSSDMNFQKNLSERTEKMEKYLRPLGIDMAKYQGLFAVSINQPSQSVTYCGFYPICAENENELNEVVTAEEYINELHINKTDFGLEFGLEYIGGQLALSFWADLPWLYTPPIEKNRYENKTTLPPIEIEQEI